jgi:tripartite-type tricarboxylate transporter receptor subunit TctC
MPGLNRFALAALIASLVPFAAATAQTYPVKAIRMIVPFAPSGTTDIVARLLGNKLSEELGQQVIIDSRAGAGSTIGTDIAAKAAPDGYTIVLNNIGLAINDTLYPKLPYDTKKDLAPISLVGITPNLFVVHPSLPAKSVKEFLAIARARPGQLVYASGGVGSSSHLATELLQILAGVRFVHVPYKGSGASLVDLAAGQVQFMINSMPALLPYAKSGRVRALAVSGGKRSPAVPDIPTIAEAGVRDYEFVTWYGLLLPAATPKPVVGRLNEVVVRALRSADVREKFAQQGVEPEATSAEQFGEIINADIEKWRKIIRDANIKAE